MASVRRRRGWTSSDTAQSPAWPSDTPMTPRITTNSGQQPSPPPPAPQPRIEAWPSETPHAAQITHQSRQHLPQDVSSTQNWAEASMWQRPPPPATLPAALTPAAPLAPADAAEPCSWSDTADSKVLLRRQHELAARLGAAPRASPVKPAPQGWNEAGVPLQGSWPRPPP